MTPDEHYEQAELDEAAAWAEHEGKNRTDLLISALVHATLATITEPPLGVIDR